MGRGRGENCESERATARRLNNDQSISYGSRETVSESGGGGKGGAGSVTRDEAGE